MNEKVVQFNIEKEKFQQTKLEIKESDNVHKYEIIFEENNPKLVKIYNLAITEICNQENDLVHQAGRTNEAGCHAWEFLGLSPNAEQIQALISEIHKKAEEGYLSSEKLALL